MYLSSWYTVNEYRWSKLSQLYIVDKGSIGWMHCVTIEAEFVSIGNQGIMVGNEFLLEEIKTILVSRNFL